jgi:hypothetical protein
VKFLRADGASRRPFFSSVLSAGRQPARTPKELPATRAGNQRDRKTSIVLFIVTSYDKYMTRISQKAAGPRGRPPTGKAQSPAERMRRYRSRQRAAGLRPVTRLESPARTLSVGALRHRALDARSLAMHCVAAAKIERDPGLLETVRKTFQGWRSRYGNELPRALEEWAVLLRRPWPEISFVITDPGERATRMRQSSPFSTILSTAERERVYAAFRP